MSTYYVVGRTAVNKTGPASAFRLVDGRERMS